MHKVPWMKSDLVQKPISPLRTSFVTLRLAAISAPLRRQPCCTVKLFFRTGPEKPISPLCTSFVTPRPPPANPAAAAAVVPAPFPILSVKCKMLKHNLLRKRGVSVFDTPLLRNPLKISILHFTPGRWERVTGYGPRGGGGTGRNTSGNLYLCIISQRAETLVGVPALSVLKFKSILLPLRKQPLRLSYLARSPFSFNFNNSSIANLYCSAKIIPAAENDKRMDGFS